MNRLTISVHSYSIWWNGAKKSRQQRCLTINKVHPYSTKTIVQQVKERQRETKNRLTQSPNSESAFKTKRMRNKRKIIINDFQGIVEKNKWTNRKWLVGWFVMCPNRASFLASLLREKKTMMSFSRIRVETTNKIEGKARRSDYIICNSVVNNRYLWYNFIYKIIMLSKSRLHKTFLLSTSSFLCLFPFDFRFLKTRGEKSHHDSSSLCF